MIDDRIYEDERGLLHETRGIIEIILPPPTDPCRHPKREKLPPKMVPNDLRMHRFLICGTESPVYFPAHWESHKYFTKEKLTFIEEYFVDIQKLIDALLHAKSNYPHQRPYVFALAYYIKISKSNILQTKLYAAASAIIQLNEEFLQFIYELQSIYRDFGRGWRNFVARWYKSMPPHKLALEVSKRGGLGNWKHKDIVKLAHLKVEESNIALQCVIKYILFGYKSAKEEFQSQDAAHKVLEILDIVNDLRHCEDPVAAANLISQNQFLSLEHVPSHLITNGQVWIALLSRIETSTLLKSLESLHRAQLLGDELDDGTRLSELQLQGPNVTDISDAVVAALKDKVTCPTLAYITLRNYSSGGRPIPRQFQDYAAKDLEIKMKMVMLVKGPNVRYRRHPLRSWPKKRGTGVVLPPCPAVVVALTDLVHRSLAPQKKEDCTPLCLLVTLDMRDHMFKGFQQCRLERKRTAEVAAASTSQEVEMGKHRRYFSDCFNNKNIRPGNAAILLALQLSGKYKEVIVAVFGENGIEEVPLWKNNELLSPEKAEEEFKKVKTGLTLLDSPMQWAEQNNKKVDLFVNLVDMSSRRREIPKKERSTHNAQATLYKYQEIVPNAGMVNVFLAGFRGLNLDPSGSRVLDIIGFNEFIPSIIHTFATSAKNKI